MDTVLKSTGVARAAIVMAALLLLLPFASYAQSSVSSNLTVLQATIRAAILKDPRSASMSQAQIDAMVSALASQAQSQGVTAQDIAYNPGTPVPTITASYPPEGCTDISSSLCTLGQALGFDTPDKEVPIGLWITSGLLIGIIWLMRRNPHLSHLTGVSSTDSVA
jgi:hypothetical protein